MYTRRGNIKEAWKIKKFRGLKNIKKFFAMFVSFSLLNIITIFSTVQAVDTSSANIVSGGECGNLLKYKGNVVLVHYVEYKKDGVSYPAYCLDKTKPRSDRWIFIFCICK